MSASIQASRISTMTEAEKFLGSLSPNGLSPIFDPFLLHEIKEALEAGGEVYSSQDPKGKSDGLFIYDNYEATGTIFTRSREAFDHFYKMKPSSYIFSEVEVSELQKEVWNIWQLDVDHAHPLEHRFKHQASMDQNVTELEHFIAATQPETNRKWISVALKNGDKCFVVKMGERIVGIAWLEVVGNYARSHGLYVEPQFRKMGVMRDNFEARLIYLKSRHVHTLINEIAESNTASSKHAASIGEKIVGKIYLYTSPEPHVI